MAFGTTLTDAQASLDRQRGADAANLYNSLLAVMQRQEAGSERSLRQREGEAERAVKYFQIGEGGKIDREKLQAEALKLDKQIEAETKRQQDQIRARAEELKLQGKFALEQIGEQGKFQKEIAEIQAKQLNPRVAQEVAAIEAETEQLNTLADAAAKRANARLGILRAQRDAKIKKAQNQIFFMGLDRPAFEKAAQERAQQEFTAAAVALQDQLGEGGQLIYLDQKTEQFQPVKMTGPVRSTARPTNMLPGLVPSSGIGTNIIPPMSRERYNPATRQFEPVR